MDKYDLQDKRLARVYDAVNSIADVLGENYIRADWCDREDEPMFIFGKFTVRASVDSDIFDIESMSMRITCAGIENTAWLLVRIG